MARVWLTGCFFSILLAFLVYLKSLKISGALPVHLLEPYLTLVQAPEINRCALYQTAYGDQHA
jgi:hypothetical protein